MPKTLRERFEERFHLEEKYTIRGSYLGFEIVPSPDKLLSFIEGELAQVRKEVARTLSVGTVQNTKFIGRKIYSPEARKYFMEGFKFARNNLQRQKNQFLHPSEEEITNKETIDPEFNPNHHLPPY